ncbi:6-phosphogluconate dehydrogenase, C-terminal domain [Streptomyces mirabilis]|uniref:6-phosphogluconate dehydrogenase, C-terminal domain n=1 Tax=Streptomyces mirabilis TaxID=68239 RepID=A0A1I2KL27_9ACTN|nr:6-phosphogluconate dehydrogenase, C-terminal domain [Streptomyces mirabilis]
MELPSSAVAAVILDRIRSACDTRADLPSLLSDDTFAQEIASAQDDWRDVIVAAGRPVPGFSAALAYYDALRAERLPAALTQGQRDFFGAHTYRRTDRDGSFHTLWGGDRSER